MDIAFLGQGYDVSSKFSVGYQLIRLFTDQNFHTFTGISAFASLSGIKGLSKHIDAAKKHLLSITIITGVDQKGTSKEALEELLALGINAFVFYQPSKTIFHPKLYLFEGNNNSELIIGSSNLTSQGLFSNIEVSLLVNIDNSNASDRKIIDQLKQYFKGIFDHSDPNLITLSTALIADLMKVNIIPTEEERKLYYEKTDKAERKEIEKIISEIFPKRAIAGIPSEFRGGSRLEKLLDVQKEQPNINIISANLELLWESRSLTHRDLNIPKGSNTNPTGSMLFKKGRTKGIDQRHFFRDTVFSDLDWKHDNKKDITHLERAKAIFQIIIGSKDYGNYELSLTHNSKTDTRSYQQKNSMTSISWGEAKKVIARDELIGKNVKLYRNNDKSDFFTLIIG